MIVAQYGAKNRPGKTFADFDGNKIFGISTGIWKFEFIDEVAGGPTVYILAGWVPFPMTTVDFDPAYDLKTLI